MQTLIADIDRMMDELAAMRRRLADVMQHSAQPSVPVSQWEMVGMWADREDMQGLSTEEWLARLRAQQWGPTNGDESN
jgi:hypothetical protein